MIARHFSVLSQFLPLALPFYARVFLYYVDLLSLEEVNSKLTVVFYQIDLAQQEICGEHLGYVISLHRFSFQFLLPCSFHSFVISHNPFVDLTMICLNSNLFILKITRCYWLLMTYLSRSRECSLVRFCFFDFFFWFGDSKKKNELKC